LKNFSNSMPVFSDSWKKNRVKLRDKI